MFSWPTLVATGIGAALLLWPRKANVRIEIIRGFEGKEIPIRNDVAMALQDMIANARLDGIKKPLLEPVSGYRTMTQQKNLWEKALKKYGSVSKARIYTAQPGTSVHQTGRGVDLYLGYPIDSSYVDKMKKTKAWKWLSQNAGRFRFFPYSKEPWHWEWGKPHTGNALEIAEEVKDLQERGFA